MKIRFEEYDPNWMVDFKRISSELKTLIGFLSPQIEHIGSTSVKGLSAKPIVDVLVGVNNESDLDLAIRPLIRADYVYYEVYNATMPYRRFFVKHKVEPQSLSIPKMIVHEKEIPNSTEEHHNRLAHVHILPLDSEHYLRHIAFRDYLRCHPKVRDEYQQLKQELSDYEWLDGNEYNQAKDRFIKVEESKAIDWYQKRLKSS